MFFEKKRVDARVATNDSSSSHLRIGRTRSTWPRLRARREAQRCDLRDQASFVGPPLSENLSSGAAHPREASDVEGKSGKDGNTCGCERLTVPPSLGSGA